MIFRTLAGEYQPDTIECQASVNANFSERVGEVPDHRFMSQVLIQQYLNQLQDLRKVSGTHREMAAREAFKELLKRWASSRN
jgi:hypothetical protein